MKRIFVTLYLLLFVFFCAQGQTYLINRNPFLDTLFQSKEDVTQISQIDFNHFLPVFIKKAFTNQIIIKNSRGLFILIEGTGQVYKALDTNKNKIVFKRIDSTVYFGNNFSALIFSKNDTLISFGGYGYWHLNGQLRFFNDGYEWNVKKINKEFTTNYHCAYYSAKDFKIYFLESKSGEEVAFTELANNHEIISLDLKSFRNKILGKPSKEFSRIIKGDNFIYLPSLNGIIIVSDHVFFLCNYKENSIYKLTNEKILNAFNRNSNELIANFFEKNGKIYFTNYPEYEVKTFPISMKDFTLEPYRIFEPVSEINNFFIIFGSLFLVFTSLIVFYYLNKKNTSVRLN
jgi:hypothetical protein